jgi:hypothetical protein
MTASLALILGTKYMKTPDINFLVTKCYSIKAKKIEKQCTNRANHLYKTKRKKQKSPAVRGFFV